MRVGREFVRKVLLRFHLAHHAEEVVVAGARHRRRLRPGRHEGWRAFAGAGVKRRRRAWRAMPHVVVLGAGPGGLTAATELASALPRGSVTLVDERDSFLMGLAKLAILDGRRTAATGRRMLRDVERHGVRFLQAKVESVDPATRTVRAGDETLRADHLVVALGTTLDAGGVPGLAEAGRNVYTTEGAAAFHRDLASFPGGEVLLVVHSTPFKCPPGPYEATMLTKAFLDRRGVDARVAIASPEPQPMPSAGPAAGEMVAGFLAERGITLLAGRTLREVDPHARIARFANGEERRFDLLAFVPRHRAPAALAGLVDASGFVPVDARTLATGHAGVHAIGDCTLIKLANGKPLVKAGVMAEAEGRVVARNVLDALAGRPPSAAFDGKGYCFLELGGGEGVQIEGDFYAMPAPDVRALPPSPAALQAKARFEEERLRRWFGGQPLG